MAPQSTAPPYDKLAELAELAARRQARRRILLWIVATISVVTFAVVWKVGRHLTATALLEANRYRVIWGMEPHNKRLGGGTTVKYVNSGWSDQSSLRNFDLRYLASLHRVEELELTGSHALTDADLEVLDKLTSLRVLNLDRTKGLTTLSSVQGRLTDRTLARIKHLRNLKDLNLGGQAISDEGLKNLAGLDQLENLEIRQTEITEVGLEHLKGLPRLKSLDLMGTKIPLAAIQKFQLARLDVKILDDSTP